MCPFDSSFQPCPQDHNDDVDIIVNDAKAEESE
jgi:hypothetical protein